MKYLKWVSLVIFIVAFLSTQGVFSIQQIIGYEEFLMIGAGILAFLRATNGKWFGVILMGVGVVFWQAWLPNQFGNMLFRHEWVMMGGYISIFFSAK